jgi:hypothetical protein
LDKIGKSQNKDLTCPICLDINVIANKTATNSDLIPASLSYNEYVYNANILIDTGALQSNYIQKEIAKLLESKGIKRARSEVIVCSGVCGLCAKTSEIIYFDLTILNECNDNYFTFPTKAIVINLKYDLVIGRSDINVFNIKL